MASSLSSDAARELTCLFQEHARAVRGYLLGITRRHDVADDLLQDVFRRAWQARDRYDDRGRARAWLLCIADRLACDHLRRLGREVSVSEEAWQSLTPETEDETPLEQMTAAELSQDLAIALDALSPPQRRVLLLRYYSEMSFAEIADAMQCPLSTVLSHCRRGLQALRAILERAV